MKKYIVVGIMAAGLLASGCGKFVRDELITMQNEIDQIENQVKQMNASLSSLKTIVDQMAEGGYVVDVKAFKDERGGYTLVFNDGTELKLYSGVDGRDGKDAFGPAIAIAKDETGHWCWTLDGEFLTTEDGQHCTVDGKDGVTPQLKIDEEGYWCISMDNGETWEQKKDWPARGKDADEIFQLNPVIGEDYIDLVLSATGETIRVPFYRPLDVELSLEGQDVNGLVLIYPGETLSISYSLTGAGAENALLVAGTDGRFKTAIKPDAENPKAGTVEVTGTAVDAENPYKIPEGSYIYITVNDGNGRSQVKVIRFASRAIDRTYPATLPEVYSAEGETMQVMYKCNYEMVPKVEFAEGEEPWLTVTAEVTKLDESSEISYTAVTYVIQPNDSQEQRSKTIMVSPKDHPGYEIALIEITQAGKAAEGEGEGGSGEGGSSEGEGESGEGGSAK